VALIIGVAGSAAAFIATSAAVAGHETQLLEQQAGAGTAVIASTVQAMQAGLTSLASSLRTTGVPDKALSGSTAAGLSGVALLRQDTSGLQVLARTGGLQAPVPVPGNEYHPTWSAAPVTGLGYTGFIGTGTARVLGLTLSFPDGEVLYGEVPIGLFSNASSQPQASSAAASGSPFASLDFALYLGTSQSAGSLVFASTSQLPLSGHRATVMLTGSPIVAPAQIDAPPQSLKSAPGQLFLVMAPRGVLGGALDVVMPWAVLGGCLIAVGLVGAFLEVSTRRRDHAMALAAALRESESTFRQLFADNPMPMWVYDVETLRFLDVNDAAVDKYGWTRDEFLAMTLFDIRPPEERERVVETVRRRDKVVEASGPWRHLLKDGRGIEVEITSHVQEYAGHDAALVSVRDITVERALEERLRHHALHDQLTGAATRELLMAQLTEVMDRPDEVCALLMVDVTGMRQLNDSLGRDGADELLVAVCDRLTDVAGDGDRVARVGGDVFTVTLAGAPDAEVARAWALRVLAALDQPVSIREHSFTVPARAGLALAGPDMRPPDLVHNADIALVAAKEGGNSPAGSRLEVFSAERDQERLDRLALEADLRLAVEAGQLRVVYQPLVDAQERRLIGVEALVRWEHPTRGLLYPATFIPAAERCGLMPSIDAWVLAAACRQARAWLDRGLPPMTVSVNVCGHDFEAGPLLVEKVRRELERNRLPAHLLEIELTESVALRDPEEAETVLLELRALGVRVALDDFGTGYSMLDRVRDLPLDRVKIDRTFTRRATSGGASLLTAMIGMAHSLGLDVVAEGVETQPELDLLAGWGCDAIQGYLISKPVAPERIDRMLDEVELPGTATPSAATQLA